MLHKPYQLTINSMCFTYGKCGNILDTIKKKARIEGIANTYNPISSGCLSCSCKWLIFICMSLKVQNKSKQSQYQSISLVCNKSRIGAYQHEISTSAALADIIFRSLRLALIEICRNLPSWYQFYIAVTFWMTYVPNNTRLLVLKTLLLVCRLWSAKLLTLNLSVLHYFCNLETNGRATLHTLTSVRFDSIASLFDTLVITFVKIIPEW